MPENNPSIKPKNEAVRINIPPKPTRAPESASVEKDEKETEKAKIIAKLEEKREALKIKIKEGERLEQAILKRLAEIEVAPESLETREKPAEITSEIKNENIIEPTDALKPEDELSVLKTKLLLTLPIVEWNKRKEIKTRIAQLEATIKQAGKENKMI